MAMNVTMKVTKTETMNKYSKLSLIALSAIVIALLAIYFLGLNNFTYLNATQIQRDQSSFVKTEAPAALILKVGPQSEISEATNTSTKEVERHEVLSVYDENIHPHPQSEEHQDLYRENTMSFDVLGAIDTQDVEGLRSLYAEYQLNDPMNIMMMEGVRVIADCLEDNNEASRHAGQIYYDNNKASRLRRYVRRYCL